MKYTWDSTFLLSRCLLPQVISHSLLVLLFNPNWKKAIQLIMVDIFQFTRCRLRSNYLAGKKCGCIRGFPRRSPYARYSFLSHLPEWGALLTTIRESTFSSNRYPIMFSHLWCASTESPDGSPDFPVSSVPETCVHEWGYSSQRQSTSESEWLFFSGSAGFLLTELLSS